MAAYLPQANLLPPQPARRLHLVRIQLARRSQDLSLHPGLVQAYHGAPPRGLQKARAEGKTLGPPRVVDDGQVEAMARLRREGHSLRSIGRLFGVSRTTVQRRLQEAVHLEEDTNDW